jgi:hypothetical protein
MIARERLQSVVRLRALPRVMLVRLEPGEEPSELGLVRLPVSVLRVRHPLPACERMRVMRPQVVIVGPSVVDRDLALLMHAAGETDAAILHLGSLVDRETLADWLLRAIELVTASRAERDEETLPLSRPSPVPEAPDTLRDLPCAAVR